MKSRRPPRLKAVLKLPRSVHGVVDYARALHFVLTDDPKTFPSPGTTVWFRHRAVLPTGLTEWSTPVKIIVL